MTREVRTMLQILAADCDRAATALGRPDSLLHKDLRNDAKRARDLIDRSEQEERDESDLRNRIGKVEARVTHIESALAHPDGGLYSVRGLRQNR